MKHFLLILLLIPIFSFSQIPSGINYQAIAYDSDGYEVTNQNMTVRLGIISGNSDSEVVYSEVHDVLTNNFGLFTLIISEGESSNNFSSINWENGVYLKVEFDQYQNGEFVLLGIHSFSSVPYSLFAQNIPTYYSNHIDSLENIIETVIQYFGCKDYEACNYDSNATISDNSCIYPQEGYDCFGICVDTDGDQVCDVDEIEGCLDELACNYVSGATNDDGSCEYQIEYYNCSGDCINDDDGDGTCDELEEGCTDETADNYNPQALNSSNCIYFGCMDNTAGNYNPIANQDDGSCILAEGCPYDNYLEYSPDAISYNESLCINIIVQGCTDNTALNYNPQANLDDESCEFIYGCTENYADNYNSEATTDDGSCIYYGCTDPIAANYDETANSDDGTCLIGGCMNLTAENYNADASINDGSCIIYGCTLSSFPNYNSVATIGNGSCDMSSTDVFGCTDESTWTYQDDASIDNGTCYYGSLPEIGDLILGGIVFYIDETGQHGLVAAMEDLGQFQWGCVGTSIYGADGVDIGTGYMNTTDIVSGCSETPISASEALAYIGGGYSDWYLPSFNELQEMYNTIGNGGVEGNIGGFSNNFYWSSTEQSIEWGLNVYFPTGSVGGENRYKGALNNVRVIRNY